MAQLDRVEEGVLSLSVLPPVYPVLLLGLRDVLAAREPPYLRLAEQLLLDEVEALPEVSREV